jgi:hypothetical protein
MKRNINRERDRIHNVTDHRPGYYDHEYDDFYDQEDFLTGRYKERYNSHYSEENADNSKNRQFRSREGRQQRDRVSRNSLRPDRRNASSMGGHSLHAGYDFEQAGDIRNTSQQSKMIPPPNTRQNVRRRRWRFGGNKWKTE